MVAAEVDLARSTRLLAMNVVLLYDWLLTFELLPLVVDSDF